MNAQAELLLVEDDDDIAEVVGLHLRQAGCSVHREADGRRALATLAERRFDLVLLDLMLPGADGLDICRHLRERDAWVPIVILSARATEVHRVLGLELGADDYLVKPFSMLEMTARVRALLRRAARMQPPPGAVAAEPRLAFGHWRLDATRRELVAAGGSRTALTLREFDLLHFLLRHPGEVFSRSALLARVWGEGFDGYEHTVNSHINRLRAKIEADPQQPGHIVTVWGLGYRFEPGPVP